MLSESKKIKGCYSKFELPMLDEPRTVRIRFCKTGSLQFISHLDLQRTFHRILVRAGIPMWYTKGFNPHAKLVFGAPLSVGTESMCEMADLKIERKITLDAIKEQLNAQLTDEMYVLEAYIPTMKYSDIAYADYTVTLKSAEANDKLAKKIAEIFSSPVMMLKKTKSGENEVDITKFIKKIDVKFNGKDIVINTVLSCGSTENLNPEYLIRAIKRECAILDENENRDSYRIMRNKFFTSYLEEFR